MSHQVEISDETWALLLRCAKPFTDKQPEDTIRRALEAYEKIEEDSPLISRPAAMVTRPIRDLVDPKRRIPRERGASVEIDGRKIDAASVRELFELVLRFLVDNHEQRLAEAVPFKTSPKRYLVAKEPTHPSGNPFVIPVKYGRYYIEAHKDYKNAVSHMRQLVQKMGLPMRYMGR